MDIDEFKHQVIMYIVSNDKYIHLCNGNCYGSSAYNVHMMIWDNLDCVIWHHLPNFGDLYPISFRRNLVEPNSLEECKEEYARIVSLTRHWYWYHMLIQYGLIYTISSIVRRIVGKPRCTYCELKYRIFTTNLG